MTTPLPRPSGPGAARAATALRAASAWADGVADGVKPLARAGIIPPVPLHASLGGVAAGYHDPKDAQTERLVHLQELPMIT